MKAKFYKVSFEQFAAYGDEEIYKNIALPRRATAHSAGYDFLPPTTLCCKRGKRRRSPREYGRTCRRTGVC